MPKSWVLHRVDGRGATLNWTTTFSCVGFVTFCFNSKCIFGIQAIDKWSILRATRVLYWPRTGYFFQRRNGHLPKRWWSNSVYIVATGWNLRFWRNLRMISWDSLKFQGLLAVARAWRGRSFILSRRCLSAVWGKVERILSEPWANLERILSGP